MDKFNITLKKIGTCWYATTLGNEQIYLCGMGYDDDDSVAIIEALKAVGRAIVSNKLAMEKLQK